MASTRGIYTTTSNNRDTFITSMDFKGIGGVSIGDAVSYL